MKGNKMDFAFLLNSEFSENLKCAICQNYLSYLPVYVTSNGQNICGRCSLTPEEKKYTRNLAFEALSQFVQFPCRFKNEGCDEKMLPKDLPQHEQNCPYKIITCPSSRFTCCDWEGAFPTVIPHCLDSHFEYFLKENREFDVDLTQSHQSENLFKYKQSLYIFSKKFDATSNILQCAIYHIEGEMNMENYSYSLTLRNGKRVLSDECCTTVHHEKAYICVALDCLKTGANVVFGKINIENGIEDEASVQERINAELLRTLQCTGCSAYVLPPICYYYDCKMYCPTCSVGVGCHIFKSYNLDNMASLLTYPCKYKASSGCNVTLKPEQMIIHQKVCQYGQRVCFFSECENCPWNGMTKDLLAHIQEIHKEKFRENGEETLVQYNCIPSVHEYIIKYSSNFFRILFSVGYKYVNGKVVDQIFKWVVQKIGHLEDTFMYDIEIVDKHGHGRKFVGRQACLPFTVNNNNLFQNKKYCCFSYSQIDGLLLDAYNVSFKVNIFFSN